MSEVMNVLGDECRGDECRTIVFVFFVFAFGSKGVMSRVGSNCLDFLATTTEAKLTVSNCKNPS